MTAIYDNGTALSVTGVTKTHARRAIRYMAARSMAAFYRAADKSLNAFEFKHGRAWTYQTMHNALDATK